MFIKVNFYSCNFLYNGFICVENIDLGFPSVARPARKNTIKENSSFRACAARSNKRGCHFDAVRASLENFLSLKYSLD